MLDENAFAGTVLGGQDDGEIVLDRHSSQNRAVERITERNAVFVHVGDAIFELNKHVGAVVQAKPIAGAQILINPHAHQLTVATSSRRWRIFAHQNVAKALFLGDFHRCQLFQLGLPIGYFGY